MLLRSVVAPTDLPSRLQTGARSFAVDGFGDTMRLFRRYRRGLLTWIAGCLLIALAYVTLATPEYTATAEMLLVSRPLQEGANSGARSASLLVDNIQIESQIQIARSEKVLRYVFDILGFRDDPEFGGASRSALSAQWFGKGDAASERKSEMAAFQSFSDHVVVRRAGQSLVLEFSFRSFDPARAARVANALAYSFIRYQIGVRVLETRRSGDWLKSRIDDLDAQDKAVTLAAREGGAPTIALTASPVQIIGAAVEPLAKSSPSRTLTLFSALTFALLTGLGAVSIRRGLDRRIRSRRQIRRDFDIECLGVAPFELEMSFSSPMILMKHLRTSPPAGFRRASEAIASAVIGGGRRGAHAPRIIGVVACHRYAGATTIATALAMAAGGRGGATAFAEVSVANPIAPIDDRAPAAPGGIAPTNFHHLDFGALLGLSRAANSHTQKSETELADRLNAFDHIVIDFPALTESSSALSHSRLIDGIVLVVEYEKTSTEQLDEALYAIALTDTPILGVVLNKARDGA